MLVAIRKWILAAIAVSVVFLGGCASPTPEPTPTVTAASNSVEDEFVHDIELYESNWEQYGNREELISLGYKTCESLTAGVSLDEYVAAGDASGLPYEFMTTMLAASIVNFCPEFLNALNV